LRRGEKEIREWLGKGWVWYGLSVGAEAQTGGDRVSLRFKEIEHRGVGTPYRMGTLVLPYNGDPTQATLHDALARHAAFQNYCRATEIAKQDQEILLQGLANIALAECENDEARLSRYVQEMIEREAEESLAERKRREETPTQTE
jgi:hypothetical protein